MSFSFPPQVFFGDFNMMNEDLYVLFNIKTKTIYRAQSWAGGRPSMEMKTWKTLKGAMNALAKLKKPNQENILEIRKLDIKDINE